MGQIERIVQKLKKQGRGYLAALVATLCFEFKHVLKSARVYFHGKRRKFQYHGLNPTTITKTQAAKNPILLLHGNYHNQSAWLELAQKIHKADPERPIYTLNMPVGYIVPKHYTLINRKIKSIQRQYERWGTIPPIHLIGHSMGGFLAQLIGLTRGTLKHLNGIRHDIGKIILLGSVFNEKQCKSFRPLQKNSEYKNRIYQIDGKYDLLVDKEVRQTSTILPQNFLEVPCGHLGLLHSNRVHNQIMKWLNE